MATWNINSVRLRLPLLLEFLEDVKPDILCLQETKCPNDQFPLKALHAAGYHYSAINGQKGYHGVATLSKRPLTQIEMKDFCDKGDCRHICVCVQAGKKTIRIHNFYVPAGGDEPDPEMNIKFRHKLNFLEEMKAIVADMGDGFSSILVGDLNIAPLEHDVWSHKQLLKIVSHTPIETDTLKALLHQGGWVDLMRQQVPEPEKLFTWWSYRAKDWSVSNRGRRLDHIWASADLSHFVQKMDIMTKARGWQKPSDHVPVIMQFDLD
ncbi:exodeoxyribonuclease III [Bartonella tamiae Th307]|uniref:Exodeoxyribonuclease III n=1 Tax=Bartonella tamiae Th239 TaxID=1094558 RepID=J0R711_9HYPH|nr:exodeoxyribonuclease III [Bartonella tamiae Th239]EJF92512.1 exodeoxyribonuclease III [Bartonella tamiae Th307]